MFCERFNGKCRVMLGLLLLLIGLGGLFAWQQAQTNKKHQTSGDVITNGIGMQLVWVPPGEFMMGSPSSESRGASTEGPQHRVKITQGFYMGIYEVTQSQYEQMMGRNPSHFKGDTNPVEEVSWHNAVEFCKKLSRQGGMTYRLPTESQWEYAFPHGRHDQHQSGEL